MILIRNLKKGKARKEPRCDYQLIPYPSKFLSPARLYRLYADLILMEKDDTLVSGASLYNNFKIYKNAQMYESMNQKLVRVKIENRDIPVMDWRAVTEKLGRSDSKELKNWTQVIREYCERYENVVKKMQKDQDEMTNNKQVQLVERNKKLEQFRQNIMKTYPYAESKVQFINGQMQITEMSFSEKYLAELGFTIDEFTSTVFQEGMPEILSLSSHAGTSIAKLRLEKYMAHDQDGYQTPDFDSNLVMKNGSLKKIKYRVYYYTCFEKGVPGFVLIGAIVGKEKALIKNTNQGNQTVKINSDFVDFMCGREQERDNFLASYYDKRAEKKYLDTYKTCKVKEIEVIEKIEG